MKNACRSRRTAGSGSCDPANKLAVGARKGGVLEFRPGRGLNSFGGVLLHQTLFGQRHDLAVADNPVIENPYVNDLQDVSKPLGDGSVRP